MNGMQFRIGTTSYIYPADIVTNVRRLAGKADDVELVLFEAGEESNLPSDEVLSELKYIASRNRMSYTVHLPLSLELGSDNDAVRDDSVRNARRVIDTTGPIDPFAYVIHLNPPTPGSGGDAVWLRWCESCTESLSEIAATVRDKKSICIENLESYPIERLMPVLEASQVSLCLDVGHLWVQGVDPLRWIVQYMERIRVVHVHGIKERDHASLKFADKASLGNVLGALVSGSYDGVLTMEVFNRRDLSSSLKVIRKTMKEATWKKGEIA